MSQVLEKPILLDETGQAIAGKLDTNSAAIVEQLDNNNDALVDILEDIKDAIGTSSEFIPVMIKVVSSPTKTLYNVGERLDLTGMVVNLVGTNGVQIDVTQACTFVPANNAVLTAENTSVAITYHYASDNIDFSTSQALTIRALDSIAVTTSPIKTAYQTGETLDLTGIVVTATYTDGFTANVTPDCVFVPQNGTVLSSSDTSVTVTYTEGGTTKTTTVAIGVKDLVSIAVTHLPVKTSYKAGEILDLTGLVVTATYDDSSTLDVTARCTFSPDDGDTLGVNDTSITITYTEGSITKTTSQVLTIISLLSIAITTPPTETEYTVEDTLDLTGIVVTATYTDASTAVVTSHCTFSPADGATLSINDTTVTVTYIEAGVTKTAMQSIDVSYPIYGVEWDGTSDPTMTRTDAAADFVDPVPTMSDGNGGWTAGSSPFDTIQPWAGMEKIYDADVGYLVKIPKFYYKHDTTNGYKLQISMSKPDNTWHTSPAHMDRGDGEGERDLVYVGAHLSDKTTHKSLPNVEPRYNSYRSAYRTEAHQLGGDIWLMDIATYFTILMLYVVEYASWDTCRKIGGKPWGGSGSGNTGQCSDMTYHTGTTATSRGTAGFVQYRNIEDWTTNRGEFLDGCYTSNSETKYYVILNPANFGESGGVYAFDQTKDYSKDTIKSIGKSATTEADWFLFGTSFLSQSSSMELYLCSAYNKSSQSTWTTVGVNKGFGVLSFSCDKPSGIASSKSYRLMKLPAN